MAQLRADSSQPTANSQLPNAGIVSTFIIRTPVLEDVLRWVGVLSAVSCKLSARRLGR
jgi:hypothetical protein